MTVDSWESCSLYEKHVNRSGSSHLVMHDIRALLAGCREFQLVSTGIVLACKNTVTT
jgi:hypothetical protein